MGQSVPTMQRPAAAFVGGMVGAFFGVPQLGYALGGLVGGSRSAGRFDNLENFKGATLPPLGSRKVADGIVWADADALQDGYKRFAPMCAQCGAPHEQHTTACGYCLTPRGSQHKAAPIAPQPAPCWR